MRPEVPSELLERAGAWHELHRWERSELGKALRRLGLTYGEIREIVPVPKATLSNWCRDVELSPEQIDAIRGRAFSQAGIPRDTQRKRREEVRSIRESAREAAPRLAADPLFVVGVALYWAEGSKSRNDFSISNADPAVLSLFIKWVRSYLDQAAEFRLSLHLHEGNSDERARGYWQEVLGLPTARFTKTFIKARGTGHRKNHLEHGVCRVRVCRSADHWYQMMEWISFMRDHLA